MLSDPTQLSFQAGLWNVELSAAAKSSPLILHELLTAHECPTPTADTLDLLEHYILPEQLRPRVSHNCYTEGVPVIDLMKGCSSEPQLSCDNISHEEVAKALEEWRIFHIVNHGVPQEVISGLRAEAARLFALPLEQKMRGHDTGSMLGYTANEATVSGCDKLPWSEAFTVMGTPNLHVREYASRIWPDDHQTFSLACEEYGRCLRELADSIMDVLIKVMGVDGGHFKEMTSEPLVALHPNYYPVCPEPEKTLGLGPHTDPGIFTLLLLDENVGGLQIQKDNEWIAIKPLQNAITYITGDSLEVISQRRFKAVPHRAVTNSSQSRSSASFMYAPNPTAKICSPPELITEQHPQIYRHFTWDDILAIRKSRAQEIHEETSNATENGAKQKVFVEANKSPPTLHLILSISNIMLESL